MGKITTRPQISIKMIQCYGSLILLPLIIGSCSKDEPALLIEEEVIPVIFGFEESSSSKIEGAAGNIEILFDRPLDESLSFDLVLSGDAVEGVDYIITNGTNVLVEAGQSATSVAYELIDDMFVESDETFTIAIENTLGLDSLNIENSSFDFVITDNDDPAILQFELSNSEIGDFANTTRSIDITFDRFLREPMEIEVMVVGGNAVQGEDYIITSPLTQVIGAGSNSPSIIILDILANDNSEMDETIKFEVKIKSGLDAVLGSITTHTLTIEADNDIAGLYKVLESDYYRIGVQSGLSNWVGQERFISPVDEDTYSYDDYWGPFVWTGSSFNFDINADNSITVPVVTSDGLFSGNRVLLCDLEPGMFTNVSCAGSNVLTRDDVTGKHIIRLTYGYFTDGSGAREYYEVLEKIVN